MLHHTIIPWSPERMRRLIFSLISSSGNAANVPKPTSIGMTSSQIRIASASHSHVRSPTLPQLIPYPGDGRSESEYQGKGERHSGLPIALKAENDQSCRADNHYAGQHARN